MNSLNYQYFKEEKHDLIAQKVFARFILILLVFYACLFVLNVYFQQNFRYVTINGVSMRPTLNNDSTRDKEGNEVQDGVYIKLTKDIDYGDIIIIDRTHKYDTKKRTIIKRALGFAGDKITIAKINKDGKKTLRYMRIPANNLNNTFTQEEVVVYEDYIRGYDIWDEQNTISILDNGIEYENGFYKFILNNEDKPEYKHFIKTYYIEGVGNVKFFEIPKDNIFYMGDNRTQSSDGRVNGPCIVDNVVGKVVAIAHNATCAKNSPIWWLNRVFAYFEVIGNEIIKYFSWKA